MEVEVCLEASTLHSCGGHTELDYENTSLDSLLCCSEQATLVWTTCCVQKMCTICYTCDTGLISVVVDSTLYESISIIKQQAGNYFRLPLQCI